MIFLISLLLNPARLASSGFFYVTGDGQRWAVNAWPLSTNRDVMRLII